MASQTANKYILTIQKQLFEWLNTHWAHVTVSHNQINSELNSELNGELNGKVSSYKLQWNVDAGLHLYGFEKIRLIEKC